MSTIKSKKANATAISNVYEQEVVDGDWVDSVIVAKYKLPELLLEDTTTTTSIESNQEIVTGDELRVLDGDDMVERTAGTVTTTNSDLQAISSSSTLETITAAGVDTTEIENTFVVDETRGVGWGTNNNTPYSIVLDVSSISSFSITYSQILVNSGLGYLNISDFDEVLDHYLLSLSDAWADNSEGHSLSINGTTIISGTTDITNRTDTVQTEGVNKIIIRMQGYTSSHSYCPCFIKDLSILVDNIKYQAPITATTNIPTKAYFDKAITANICMEATVAECANNILSNSAEVSDVFNGDGIDTFTKTMAKVNKQGRALKYKIEADEGVEVIQVNVNLNKLGA